MVITSDSEVTTYSKGSPFDLRNKVVCIGSKIENQPSKCYYDDYTEFKEQFEKATLCVFFNAKFDLHHYRKLGISIEGKRIHCCQVAEFVLSGQSNPYPSLEATAQKYGLGHKLDVIKLEYWDKGVQTHEIPRKVLSEYCIQDVELTYQIYLLQLKQFEKQPKLFALFKLMMYDLLVLEEMEWNGIKYNKQLCQQRSEEIETQISTIKTELASVYPDIALNFNSGDQLSAFLYGGPIYEETKEHVGYFKTGERKGQPKYKNVIIEHWLPRLVEPLPKTELKKTGKTADGKDIKYWQTNEPTLRKLKGPAAKKYVGPLLELAKLEKLQSTYYKGIPQKAEESYWEEGYIHGQFNQCVASTGRLSSSGPNLQNMANEMQDIFISRYGN